MTTWKRPWARDAHSRGTEGLRPRGRRDWHSHVNRRPASRGRLDLECGAEQGRTLAHPNQTDYPIDRALVFAALEAAAIVLDDQPGLRSTPLEEDGDARRVGVFVDVIERFLGDPVQSGLGVERQPDVLQAARVELRRNAEIPGP